MKKNCVKKLCKKKRQMLRNGYPRFLFHPIWHMTQPCTYFRCLWMSRQASFGSSIYYINNIGFCGFNRTHKTIKKLMKHTVSDVWPKKDCANFKSVACLYHSKFYRLFNLHSDFSRVPLRPDFSRVPQCLDFSKVLLESF